LTTWNNTGATTDRLGSIRAMDNGERYSYYPYGESHTATGGNAQYAGLESPVRAYDPNAARFNRPDPLGMKGVVMGDPGSWNRFAYAGGDPVNFVDPQGTNRFFPSDVCYFNEFFMAMVCFDWPGGGGSGNALTNPDTDPADSSSTDVVLGNETFHSVVKSGAKYNIVKSRLGTIGTRLETDRDCAAWLETGNRAALIADPTLFASIADRTGVASWIENNGQKTDGIVAQANVSSAWDIIVNGPSGFFYGGKVSGIGPNIEANSENGQILLLLHELAHLTGTLPPGDLPADMNGRNNAAVWDHCQKTIMGK
jgi:RHS repeat-associated protein